MRDDPADDEIEAYDEGLRGLVTAGTYAGLEAIVVDDCYTIDVDLPIFGRLVRRTIDRDAFAPGAAPTGDPGALAIAIGERAIGETIETETLYRERIGWWLRQAEREHTDDEAAELHAAYQAREPAVDAAEAAALAAATARLHADPRDPAHGVHAWLERAVAVRETRSAVDDDRWMAAAKLRERASAVHRARDRARYADDLAGTQPIATNPALEAMIETTLESADEAATREAFLVYADWLQSHGDPRGELASLQAGGERTARAAAKHRARHERYLVGGLDVDEPPLTAEWHLGWLHSARLMVLREHEDLGISQPALLSTLLALPSSRFLQELTLGAASSHEDGVAAAMVDALVSGGRRPTLHALRFDHDGNEEMLSWVETGDLSPIWTLYPNLRSLVIDAGTIQLGTSFAAPNLRELVLRTCALDPATFRAVCDADLPRVERLVLWTGDSDRGSGMDARDAIELFDGRALPAVRDFGLANTEHTDELCAALVASPRWRTITRLDLSQGTMTDEGAATLAAALANAPQLRQLDVSENYLSDAALAALRHDELVLVADEQREAELYEGELHRYVNTAE